MSTFWLQVFSIWWGRMLLYPHGQNKQNIFHLHDGRNTLKTQKTNGDPLGNRIRAGTEIAHFLRETEKDTARAARAPLRCFVAFFGQPNMLSFKFDTYL